MREVGQRRIWVSAVRLVLSDFTHTGPITLTHQPSSRNKEPTVTLFTGKGARHENANTKLIIAIMHKNYLIPWRKLWCFMAIQPEFAQLPIS